MNRPVRTRVTVDVDAPVERTWSEMVDWAGQGRWILSTSVRVAQGTGTEPGDLVEAVTGIRGRGLLDVMEITEFTPPTGGAAGRCAVRHIGSVVRGDGIFLAEAVSPARSRMTWIDDVLVPFGEFGRTAWLVAGEPAFRFGARRSLARFAAVAAAGGGAGLSR